MSLATCCLVPSIMITNSYVDNYFYPVYFGSLLAAALCIIISWGSMFLLRSTRPQEITLTISDLLLIAWYSLTVLCNVFAGYWLNNQLLFIFTLFIFVYLGMRQYSVNTDRSAVGYFSWIVLICGFFQILYSILQFAGLMNATQLFEVAGSFGNPGILAQFITIISIWAWAILFDHHQKTSLRLFSLIFCISTFILVIYLHSRASLAGIIICYSVFVIYRFQISTWFLQRTVAIKATLIGLVAAVAIVGAFQMYMSKHESSQGRMFIWQRTLEILADRPVVGAGFDNFGATYNEYQAEYFKNYPGDSVNANLADNKGYAFNEYLQIAAESGIASALIFIVLIVVTVFYGWKRIYNPDDSAGYLSIGASLCVLGFAIIACTGYPMRIISLFVLLFLFLMLAGGTQPVVLTLGGRGRQAIIAGVLCITLFIGIGELLRKQYYKDWKTALDIVHQGDLQNGLYAYSTLYPHLKDDKSFLFNYGAELSVAKQYEQSITVLEQAKPLMNDYGVFLYLGNSYAGMGNYTLAEQHLQGACLRIPSRIYARFRLFALYAERGDTTLARQTAQVLVNTTAKGENNNAERMKADARAYLQAHKN